MKLTREMLCEAIVKDYADKFLGISIITDLNRITRLRTSKQFVCVEEASVEIGINVPYTTDDVCYAMRCLGISNNFVKDNLSNVLKFEDIDTFTIGFSPKYGSVTLYDIINSLKSGKSNKNNKKRKKNKEKKDKKKVK